MSMGNVFRKTVCLFSSALLVLSVAAVQAEPDIPEKWFERSSGLEQALELQKETDADILLFIASRKPAGPAKRSRAFEDEFLRSRIMREFLKDYIKVKLTIPGDADTTKLAAERFYVQYGPRVILLKPKNLVMPIRIQQGEGDKREWLPMEMLQRNIIIYSSPRYENKAITATP